MELHLSFPPHSYFSSDYIMYVYSMLQGISVKVLILDIEVSIFLSEM